MSLSALDALRRLEGPEHFDVVATVSILARQGRIAGGRTDAYGIVDPPPGAIWKKPSGHGGIALESGRAPHRTKTRR